MTASNLQPDRIVSTIQLLVQRIEERFPDSGLKNVCIDVLAIGKNMEKRADWIGRPVVWLRIAIWIVVLAVIGVVLWPIVYVTMTADGTESLAISNWAEAIQLMEAGINDVVLIGAAVFFLLTVETRYKRKRALQALHEIRSVAHVIDMHQLTKDPHRILGVDAYQQTSLSPSLEMTRFELHRYLDYCSEMLALLSKIAAVYVQEFEDGVALGAAAEIETLTTGLSQKIWQKIAILSTVEQNVDETTAPSSGSATSLPKVVTTGAADKATDDGSVKS